MIFEQAFRYLPEILSGRSFPTQEHEGGIVAAFGMAVLQELNARNAPNPLSLIQSEKLYRPKNASWPALDPNDKPRYLRADMCVNLQSLKQGSAAMSAYGWRFENWLEAKFFRAFNEQTGQPKNNVNQSALTASLLIDLIRILCLCPRVVPDKIEKNSYIKNKSPIGRYLLHVYSGQISQHLSMKQGANPRPWIDALRLPGEQKLEDFNLHDEISTIRKAIGSGLDSLKFNLSTTNMVIKPVEEHPKSVTYTCILTRFDEFEVHLKNEYWGIASDRTIKSSGRNEKQIHKKISEFVGSRISLTKNIDKVKPSRAELDMSLDDGSEKID